MLDRDLTNPVCEVVQLIYLCQAAVAWEMPDSASVLSWMDLSAVQDGDILTFEYSRMLYYSEELTQIDVQLRCCCTCVVGILMLLPSR